MINFIIANNETVMATVNSTSFTLPKNDAHIAYLKGQSDKVATCDSMDAYETLMAETIAYLEGVVAGNSNKTEIEEKCNGLLIFKEDQYFLKADSELVSSIALPKILVDKLQWAVDTNNDPMPLVKLWVRWMRNPNFSTEKTERFFQYITAENVDGEKKQELIEQGYTEEDAAMLATYNDVSITNEGLLVCKKYAELISTYYDIDPETNEVVVKDKYTSVKTVDSVTGETTSEMQLPASEELEFLPPVQGTCGNKFTVDGELIGESKHNGHIIKIGARMTLPEWSMVNCDDNNTCCPGLHIGGYRYVSYYSGYNCQLLDCFVDPSQIGAIAGLGYGEDGVMRVKEYFVYGGNIGRTKGFYHSSKYAAMCDADWMSEVETAIKETEDQLRKLKSEINCIK